MTEQQLQDVLQRVYSSAALPKPLDLFAARQSVAEGTSVAQAARSIRTTAANLQAFLDSRDAVHHLFGERPDDYANQAARVRATIGQLIIGNLAERVFEDTYRDTVGTTELRLQDDRSGGGDTDYLVLNGQDRRVFRLNIKFHGSQFRNAEVLVGLAPEDCFALATYKIYSALQKQEREHLPYIFVVVGVPNLTGATVGIALPDDVVEFATLARSARRMTGKRKIEDAIVGAITSRPDQFRLRETLSGYTQQIRDAGWRVISARRASELLKALLFERVYALRVRGFAMNYRGAEVDMHFSISRDLQPLAELLQVLRDHGLPGLSVRLERGTL
jgi:hypothetical protein